MTIELVKESEISEASVVFQNLGQLDIRCITTFGVSAKIYDNPIGQFGTGLKYALAILMRHNIGVEMQIGNERFIFSARDESIRGQNFKILYMNDTALPFTTELGAHWELWMAFRELYSNCQDERGNVWLQEDELQFDTIDQTTIIVTGNEFADILKDKADVFIQSEPIIKSDELNIHEGETHAVFNKGIKVVEFDKPLLHKYDIQVSIPLTEDRTPAHSWTISDKIKEHTVASDNPELIEKILTAPKTHVESTFDFTDRWESSLSDTFKEVLARLIKKGRDKLNPTVVRLYDEIRERHARTSVSEHYKIVLKRDLKVSAEDVAEMIKTAIEEYCERYEKGDDFYETSINPITVKVS